MGSAISLSLRSRLQIGLAHFSTQVTLHMKRDLDLLRKIILALEAHEHGFAPQELQVEGYSKEQIDFHVYLLGEAGLAKVAENTVIGSESPSAFPLNLLFGLSPKRFILRCLQELVSGPGKGNKASWRCCVRGSCRVAEGGGQEQVGNPMNSQPASADDA